jgi:type IV secretory pathway VirB4 component
MKYVGLLISSVAVCLIIIGNFYYNSVTLDMQKIKDYVVESNIILEDVVEKQDQVAKNKDEYVSRLVTLKKGINNSKTTFLISGYKEYKIKSIDGLMDSILSEKDKAVYLEKVSKYNKLCDAEIDKLIINQKII